MNIWIDELDAGRCSSSEILLVFQRDSIIHNQLPRNVSMWTFFSCIFLKKSSEYVLIMLSHQACDIIVFEANIFTEMYQFFITFSKISSYRYLTQSIQSRIFIFGNLEEYLVLYWRSSASNELKSSSIFLNLSFSLWRYFLSTDISGMKKCLTQFFSVTETRSFSTKDRMAL